MPPTLGIPGIINTAAAAAMVEFFFSYVLDSSLLLSCVESSVGFFFSFLFFTCWILLCFFLALNRLGS
jgi:hypothetical protein